MRLRVLFVIVAVFVALMATESFAADTCYVATDTCYVCRSLDSTQYVPRGSITKLDWGACDTVRIGCPVVGANGLPVGELVEGDSFLVPIYLYNDAPIGGFSFPFRHYGRNLRVGFGGEDGMDFTGATLLKTSQQGGIKVVADEKTDTASVLVGWIDISGTKPIAANTTDKAKLLGSLYLVLTGTTHQVVRFDTAYYLPAGEYIASLFLPGGKAPEEYPKFVPPCDIALPVQEVKTSSLPQKFELGQNMPNPFNPNTVIVFAVPRPTEIRVEVFNVLGQKVKTLANEFSKAGYKRVEWDGTDDNGSSVASGVYLYRLTAGDFSETKKMLLLK